MRKLYTAGLVVFSSWNIACQPNPDFEKIGTLTAEDLPPSPTNAYSDDPDAATLGQALFFEKRMSADQNLGCVSCHDPDFAFSDPRAFSLGAFEREGKRHAPSLINVAFNDFQLWDGRSDSLWSQPIKAIEAPLEGDFTRTELAHFIAAEYGAAYAKIFGPLPNLDHLPARAKPGDEEWAAMTTEDQDQVNRIAANVGKAIEAYERKLLCVDTKFDRYLRGEIELTQNEQNGAQIFIEGNRARCIECHNGPNLTDGKFHNLGLDHPGEADPGRAAAIDDLINDPFNGSGNYSDNSAMGANKLSNIVTGESKNLGAFKTPGLRGVGQRSRFGHLGHHTNLERWIDGVYDRNGGGGGRGRNNNQSFRNFEGELSPLFPRGLQGNAEESIAAFLRTFDCPPLPEELLRAP